VSNSSSSNGAGAAPPSLSVIIASVNGPPAIEECLAALAAQRRDGTPEVVVADATGEATVRLIRARFPWVKVVPFAERRSIPDLQVAGLAHATGEVIAVIEDHCIVNPAWCETVVWAHRAEPECIAVGGPVENGSCERLVDWAVFFCEYSAFMPPLLRSVTTSIPGNNVSYKRRAFDQMAIARETLTKGFWDQTLHHQLLARGQKFLMEPSIVVYHKKHFGFWYFVRQRFLYSRYYAGRIAASASMGSRVARTAATLGLAPLLLVRIAWRVAQKRRHLREFLLALPHLVVFTGVWAMGELVGGVLGPGGSLREIE
jgi:GT2 family glycosyltransferase